MTIVGRILLHIVHLMINRIIYHLYISKCILNSLQHHANIFSRLNSSQKSEQSVSGVVLLYFVILYKPNVTVKQPPVLKPTQHMCDNMNNTKVYG